MNLESYSTIEKEDKFKSSDRVLFRCTLDNLVYTDCNWETCKLETDTEYTLMGFSNWELPLIFRVIIENEELMNLIHMSNHKENYSLYYGDNLNRMLRFANYMRYNHNHVTFHPLDLRSFYKVSLSDFKENGIYRSGG